MTIHTRVLEEVAGADRPLVLLHGVLSRSQVDFGQMLATLAKTRQVIAIGQHPSLASIELMADDAAARLRQLKIEQADFLGYGSGSGVAVQVAIRHPELVRTLAFVRSEEGE